MTPSSKGLRVGIIDILSFPARTAFQASESLTVTKQFANITPQAVAVWCRRAGCEVVYATYHGLGDPLKSVPAELDVLFIATSTMTSPMAYAVAKVFRGRGTVCVVGGPHARSFPQACVPHFDLVVVDCDEALIVDILTGPRDMRGVVTSAQPYEDVPLVEERLPEIRKSAFIAGRSHPGAFVPILTSRGCPYDCDFCVDWDRPYQPLSMSRLAADLRYVSSTLPTTTVAVLDPNFGVRFDEVMDVFESIEAGARNPYIAESSLSLLKPDRMSRLADTRCAAMSPGIESWTSYAHKAGAGRAGGLEKMKAVAAQLKVLQSHVRYVSVQFIFGLDHDEGSDPFELTKAFLDEVPFVWPSVNFPFPYGESRLHATALTEGRVLGTLPFSFYAMPYLTMIPKRYDSLELVDHMIDVYEKIASLDALKARVASVDYWVGKASFALHTLIARHRLRALRELARALREEPDMLAFHQGQTARLPAFYRARYHAQMGAYAELVGPEDCAMESHDGGTLPALSVAN